MGFLEIFFSVMIFFEIVFIFFAFWTIITLAVTRVPFVPSHKKNIEKALVGLRLAPGSKVYDLGCGDGKALFLAEKMGFRVTGFELSPYPYLKSVIKKYFTKSHARFVRANFFQADVSEADCVYLFLVPSVMAKVGEKLKKELKPGASVIAYAMHIPGWEAAKILETRPSKTYIYRM